MATTYLQGAYRQAAAATVRITVDPTGTPVTHDWAIAAGTVWDSVDEIIADWNASLSGPVVSVSHATGKLTVTASANVSIAWSHAGSGTALRDWLGESADAANQSSPYTFSARHQAGVYLEIPAQVVRRTSTARHAAAGLHRDGTPWTGHHRTPGDGPAVTLDVSFLLPIDGTDASALGELDEFFEEALAELARWSLYHDGDQWVCYPRPDDTLDLHAETEGDTLSLHVRVSQSWHAVELP